jgi:hypothetical protein
MQQNLLAREYPLRLCEQMTLHKKEEEARSRLKNIGLKF